MKITGNEPAYPVFDEEMDIMRLGLTIRQQFAMAAMQGMIAGKYEGNGIIDDCKVAVKYADALIAELNRTEVQP